MSLRLLIKKSVKNTMSPIRTSKFLSKFSALSSNLIQNPRPIKTEIEILKAAILAALGGEDVVYKSNSDSSKLTKETYLSIYKRILWSLRKLAYISLRSKLRTNEGKMNPIFRIQVEELVISKAGEMRKNVCEKMGIELTGKEEYFTVLQQCYFQNIANPEFADMLNKERSYHTFLLARILDGELIPELEHLDIDNAGDEALDELNQELLSNLKK